ncbi:hypothetical protein HMPREF9541_00358, partial [Escherichia coli MS 116-1]
KWITFHPSLTPLAHCAMPGAYQPQSLSGIICRVVWLTFSVGRSFPLDSSSPKETSRYLVFSKFKKKTRRVATEIKKFEKRDLAQAVIGVGVMVDFISRIMSVLADSWGCWCGLPIDEKTSNYLAYYL